MKFLIFVLITTQLFLTCNNSKPEKKKEVVKSQAELLQDKIISIEKNLKYESEKISLLAELRKMKFDTLNSIIRDYLIFTSSVYNKEEAFAQKYKFSISRLNQRYKISRSKLASLIYSYKYEMFTREEIEERAIEDYLDRPDEGEEIPSQGAYN